MEILKIVVFFLLGSFFGVDNVQLGAEKTTVTINPNNKTISIVQENLFGVIENETDSLALLEEIEAIEKGHWTDDLKNFKLKKAKIYLTKTNKINAKIKLKYKKIEDLNAFGIKLNDKGNYSFIDFPKWNYATKDGEKTEHHWVFGADKPFTFTVSPMEDMPEKYKPYIKDLLPIWKRLKNDQTIKL